MIYAIGRKGATEGSIMVHLATVVGRIVVAGAYLPEIWLRPALRGQHLKGLTEPGFHGN